MPVFDKIVADNLSLCSQRLDVFGPLASGFCERHTPGIITDAFKRLSAPYPVSPNAPYLGMLALYDLPRAG
jgi:hypothetical protein